MSFDRGNTQKAIDYYEMSLGHYENFTRALNNLANIFKDQGMLIEAKKLLEKAVDQGSQIAVMNLAVVEMNLKNFQTSEDLFIKAIQQRPYHAKSYYNLGNLVSIDCF